MEQIYIFLYKHHNDNHHDDEYSSNEMKMKSLCSTEIKSSHIILIDNEMTLNLRQIYLNFHFRCHCRRENQNRNPILTGKKTIFKIFSLIFLQSIVLPVILPSLLKTIRRLLRTIRLIDETLGNLSDGHMPSF